VLPPITLRIYTLDGLTRERAWDLPILRIGSHPTSDLILSGRGVGEHHCILEHTAGTLILRDDRSHGTFVNNEPLNQPRPVAPGDRIYVGEIQLEVLAARPPSPSPHRRWRRYAPRLALAGAIAVIVMALTRPKSPDAPAPTAVDPLVTVPVVPAPRTPPVAPARTRVRVRHEVIPGELVSDIAARYGVSVAQLVADNPINPDVPPSPGTVLEVDAYDPPLPKLRLRHKVEPGDTWIGLSERFEIGVDLLRRYNESIVGELVPGSEFIVWVDPHIERRRDVIVHAPHRVSPDARSIGAPTAGSLERGIQLPEDRALYERIATSLQYGSSHTILHLQHGIAAFRDRYGYRGVLVVANLSQLQGGELKPHASHQSGRDVDIWLPALKGTYQQKHLAEDRKPKYAEINWYAAWGLVESLLATGQVKYIFLDRSLHRNLYYAAIEMGAPRELLDKIQHQPSTDPATAPRIMVNAPVRHADAHIGHIHVRFLCGPDEPRCSERPEIEDP